MEKEIVNLIDAAFSAIWVQSWELDECQRMFYRLAEKEKWKVYTWDCVQGIGEVKNTLNEEGKEIKGLVYNAKQNSPMSPLTFLLSRTPVEKETAVVLLHNFHRFLDNPQFVQALINCTLRGKGTQTFYVVLSPIKTIPVELERIFTVIDHPLPNDAELEHIMEDMSEGQIATKAIIDAAKGMTRRQAEDAFGLSRVIHKGEVQAGAIWDLKKNFVNEKGYMSLSREGPKFDSIGGLENLKSFSRKLLGTKNPLVKPKGFLLLGMPGTGKSHFAKSLGNEFEIPTITLEFSSLFNKYVGESQRQLKEALQVVDAVGKCILFIDEMEKSFGGIGGEEGSGTNQQLFGTLLTWLNDREEKGSEAFVIGTVNDVEALIKHSQGALVRAERFDAIFMLDLPNTLERSMIWDLYENKYQLQEKHRFNNKKFDDEGYTGAEIKSCCRLAAGMNCSIKEASEYVVPISHTAGDKIAALREWAKGKCISANYPGLYTGKDAPKVYTETPRRKVTVNKET